MPPIFVDSSAWYVFGDRYNPESARTQRFFAETATPLVTSNLVFAETMSLITKRKDKSSAISFGGFLRASHKLQIVHIDAALEERAWELFAGYRDKGWDLVDCSSFLLMDQMKIEAALTFDRHFAQRGYKTFPD